MTRTYPAVLFGILSLVVTGGCVSSKPKSPQNTTRYSSFPKPTGRLPVGLRTYHFIDSARLDPFLEKRVPRELIVNLYYPAEATNATRAAPYLKNTMLRFYQDQFEKVGLDKEALSHVASMVLQEPPISTARSSYPTIIFSPGAGIVPEFYLTQIRDLVSHGFVVAAINHTYTSAISVFPDNTSRLIDPTGYKLIEKMQADGEDAQGFLIKNCSEDISQTLNALKTIELSHHLDFSRVGMLGHSLGGMAVTYLCLNSALCRAGGNMDGALLGGPSSVLHSGNLTGDLKKPFLFVIGKEIAKPIPDLKDSRYKNKNLMEALSKLSISLEEYYQIHKDRTQGRILRAQKNMGKNTSVIVFENAEHMAFSDWRLLNSYLLKDEEKADLVKTMAGINKVLRTFFMKYLYGTNLRD